MFFFFLFKSSGAFAAMALLGKLDQLLAPKGLSITVAPLGAVSALLFATPSAPSARVTYYHLCFGLLLLNKMDIINAIVSKLSLLNTSKMLLFSLFNYYNL